MRRALFAGLIILLVFMTLLPPIGAAPRRHPHAQGPPQLGPYVPDEVLVQFKPGIRPDTAAAAVGARVHSRIDGLNIHVLKVPEGTVEATVRALSNNSLVEFAEPNGYVQTFLYPNDPYNNSNQWYWATVRAYDAWDSTAGSSSVKVAVVDTGTDVGGVSQLGYEDYIHEDFACDTRTAGYTSLVAGEGGNDDNGHGTHVAGVIGACTNQGIGIAGANWSLRFKSIKVLDYSGSGTIAAVANGIRLAVDHDPTDPAKVINLSLGTNRGFSTLRNAVDYAWGRGAVVVCAAGNGGNAARTYPAYYTNCLAVAATTQSDVRASFSTYGTWVDVAAPGDQIFSMMQDDWIWCFLCYWYGVPERYATLSGTSMATSVVSGLAALIWASGICSTNTCVRNRIQNPAYTDNNGAYGIGPSSAPRGRVNFCKAVGCP